MGFLFGGAVLATTIVIAFFADRHDFKVRAERQKCREEKMERRAESIREASRHLDVANERWKQSVPGTHDFFELWDAYREAKEDYYRTLKEF